MKIDYFWSKVIKKILFKLFLKFIKILFKIIEFSSDSRLNLYILEEKEYKKGENQF